MENDLQRIGFTFFLPLQKNVKDFGMKRVLLSKHLKKPDQRRTNSTFVKLYSEHPIESRDKLIYGKIDLILEMKSGVEIIDFKTGSITEDTLNDTGEAFPEVKSEYQDQMKLYAYLYFENNEIFPEKLSLVALTRQKFNIDFTINECTSIYKEAKAILNETNRCIHESSFTGNPTESNCKFCLYRPACKFFPPFLKTTSTFNDVCGTIENAVKYQNGSVSVFINTGDMVVTISQFPEDKFMYFSKNVGKYVQLYNLRKDPNSFSFSVIKTTMVYE